MAMKKIVVVDDDETIRKTFFLLLHKKFKIYLAKDAREALQRFRRSAIDLIITDVKLPDMTGLEMVAEFRKVGNNVPVVLISAYPDLIKLEELEKLKIGYFFVKPLDLEAITRSINYILIPPEARALSF
ncbi:MAG TPA: response regulator [Candidatus Aminicenantes bacterium]|nr:response regulator [Candidatus Aminicenantes bacterium]